MPSDGRSTRCARCSVLVRRERRLVCDVRRTASPLGRTADGDRTAFPVLSLAVLRSLGVDAARREGRRERLGRICLCAAAINGFDGRFEIRGRSGDLASGPCRKFVDCSSFGAPNNSGTSATRARDPCTDISTWAHRSDGSPSRIIGFVARKRQLSASSYTLETCRTF